MITSESVIDNIFKEIGGKRSEDTTPHLLSKSEMKDILCYIVDLKNKNAKYESLLSFKKEIVGDVLNLLNEKDVSKHGKE